MAREGAFREHVSRGPLPDERRACIEQVVLAHPRWSDRWIAEVTSSPQHVVAAVRRQSGSAVVSRIGRDGRVRPVDPAVGRARAAELVRADPQRSLREIAREAGISPETARSVRREILAAEAPEDGSGARFDPVADLRVDPSLRFSESGRVLLRLLDLHASAEPRWAGLADVVPPHSTDVVARVARSCAAVWTELSRQLDSRARDTVRDEGA